ncbi:MAG: hypothetical protein OXG96_05540 [Acidobacteria bacterium]|nr:hypothetical protein [Acidobacteriota bacterium]
MGSRNRGDCGNGIHRARQASILPGVAVLCLSFLAVAPITTGDSAPSEPSNGWSQPQSGWLYVLDPEVGEDKSVVWLVDPEEGVKGGLKAGFAPFFALSPDGARLYVSSKPPGLPGSGASSYELWAIDTASGVLLQQVKLSNRLNYTLPGLGGLAVSPDGRYVHVAKSRTVRPGVHEQTIQTFDTIRNRFLPEEAGLPGCGYPIIVPVSGAWQLVVKCSSRGVGLISLAADGSVNQSQFVEVPIGLSAVTRGRRVVQRPVAQICPSDDARKLGLIMDNGEIFEAEIGDSPFRINPTLAPPLRLSHRVLHTRVSLRTPDGSKVFVGCASKDLVATSLTVDEIHVFDTASSWTREAIIRTPVPISDLVLSADGRDLYGISPQTRTLLTIDRATGQVENSIGDIGVQPRFLVIAP